MNRYSKRIAKGFTLVEMMLVTVIVSALLYMGIQYSQQRTRDISIDRASAQFQEILNAGLSFYVNTGAWPTNIAALQTGGYLPATVVSPWGTNYVVTTTINPSLMNVTTTLPAISNAALIGQILAGRLPFGVSSGGATPIISSSVNVPGMSLNNAGNVSYAGLYRNGSCVPAPKCPLDTAGNPMTRQIFVTPASVSGMNDTGAVNVYPMSSITAYATPLTATVGGVGPPACGTSASASNVCYQDVQGGARVPDGDYWRVCLQVYTTKGKVAWDNTTSPYATVTAMTRCSIVNENVGSSFNVWE